MSCCATDVVSRRVEGRMVGCVVTALCLYCRESVNRVKLREGGGCKLLVQVHCTDTGDNTGTLTHWHTDTLTH